MSEDKFKLLIEFIFENAFRKGYKKGLKKGKSIGSHQAYNKFVKHGHWVDTGRADYYLNKEYRCSCCDAVDYMRSNFCPNCGAKMDETR